MAFCRNCGTSVDEGSKFCPGCGTAVDAPAAAPVASAPVQTKAKRKSNPKRTAIGCATLLLLAAVIVIVAVELDKTPAERGNFSLPSVATTAPTAAPPAGPRTSFGDGTYIVGTDIAPGTYRAPGGDTCYWERESSLSGSSDDIIANNLSPGQQTVTIAASDKGFKTQGCGTWTKLQ